MAKFRKKPAVVEAVQRTADNWEEIYDFMYQQPSNLTAHAVTPDGHLTMTTPQGETVICPGDWVVKTVLGRLGSIKPDIFEATYEPVE